MAEITFTGNVAADAELRCTPNGAPVLNFRACDSKSRKKEDGSWETLAETWYAVSLFGAAAEALQHEVTKGARVKVAGEFYTREYEGKNGPGVSNDVRAVGVQVLPSRNQQGGQTSGGFGGATPDPRPAQQSGGWGSQQQGGDAWTGGNTGGWGAPSSSDPPF